MNAIRHRLETPLTFSCGDAVLVGILHGTSRPARRGVVIVVGGPQYRAGAHRQYVTLARSLAEAGVPTLRFDYRGMGDSGGDFRGFEDCGDDIAAAVDALMEHQPGIEEVVLWGLCDGATAIAFHLADTDRRRHPAVAGAVLLNPWARSDAGAAAARVKHYYGRRLLNPAFWRKLLAGGVDLRGAAAQALGSLRAARGGARATTQSAGPAPLPDRLAAALEAVSVPLTVILSGRDLTAREFEDTVLARRSVRRRFKGRNAFALHRMPDANHTFSAEVHRAQVLARTLGHLQSDFGGGRP
ncbi:hydrolase 1, exosortase A system-associated [Caenispirillum salinarum]|uniref:hydrolase 1, exosortase A system-associated n=1 Tax=Caenispirillum salinarum TaxID=859058 RepID=UPI000315F842|nr:hydrolase 1, exosortase A system-associated [Caenispirillum salinarum]